jgi:hypothetical protein
MTPRNIETVKIQLNSVGVALLQYLAFPALLSLNSKSERSLNFRWLVICVLQFNLPHSVTQCQFDPSNFYYDFHIEYDVVRRAQERERARLAAVADATDKSSNSDSPTPLAASQIYESARGDNVLQPTVCTADTTSSLTMTTPAQTSGLISYSEFENQSSNPFEDMELRTLDDMGELRTILQPAGDVSSVQPVPDLNSQGSASVESAGAKPVPKPRLNVPNTNEGDQGKAPVPVPRPRVKSSQNDSSAMAVKLPAGAKPTVLQAAMKQPSQPQPEPPPYPGPPLASTVGSYPTFTPPLESFPSPSDLPPPYGANADGPPPIPPRLPNQRNGNQWGGNHQPHSDLGLVNVYQTLNSAEGRLVDELCGMGFPQGQVARAVKRLGMDEKTVSSSVAVI